MFFPHSVQLHVIAQAFAAAFCDRSVSSSHVVLPPICPKESEGLRCVSLNLIELLVTDIREVTAVYELCY